MELATMNCITDAIPSLLSYRECTGMSKPAYDLLTGEDSAEWACDSCITNKTIPTIKMVKKS